jgi:hypothetical protein
MSGKAMIFCGWCGIATAFVTFIGLGPVGHLMPPVATHVSPDEIAVYFRQGSTRILLGAFCLNVAVALSIAMVAGISAQIRRMEGSSAPVLSYLQLAAGTTASLFIMLPVMIWNVAVYRPERSPETLLMLHDFATFATFLPFSVATLEALVIAAAIFSDRSPTPVFPRWLGYLNIASGLSDVPMGFGGFVKDGMFATDGLYGFVVPTVLVLPWYVLMGFYLIKAGKAISASASN